MSESKSIHARSLLRLPAFALGGLETGAAGRSRFRSLLRLPAFALGGLLGLSPVLALRPTTAVAAEAGKTGTAAQTSDVVKPSAKPASPPPNIIVILADDLGYGDLGAYGGRAIKTPHIDDLAAQGIRFTDFHASDSVCTPSRAGLLTGRYARRMGLDDPLHPGGMSLLQSATVKFGYLMGRVGVMDLATVGDATGLNDDEITLAEALKVAGYSTAMIGKWHLGDFRTDPQHNPRRHGFDHYFGVPYSNDMHPFPLYRDYEQLQANVDDQTTLTRLYTEEAVRFIEASHDQPFFLYFAQTFPHRPLFASEAFHGRSAGGIYGDTVEELDWSLGQLIDALKRKNLLDNTLVMFTSDNGPWYEGSPGGFRGRKGQSFEGGHRVPFIAQWPARIPPGQVSNQLAINIDLLPTALALAGLAPPDDRPIDGKNIVELLTVPGSPSPHERLFFYHEGELEAVREGKWKYFRSVNHYVWPLPVNKALGHLSEHTTGPLPLLFDLKTDPTEAYNVADRHPQVAARLAAEITKFEAALSP